MSWKRSAAKRKRSRARQWIDVIEIGGVEDLLKFQYRRCSPYVEARVSAGLWDKVLWHMAILESRFNRATVEELDAVAKNILKRLAERKAKAKTGSAVSDPLAEKKYPNLFTLMTALLDDDKQPRRVATLTLFADDGAFKVCLNERNVSLSLWAASETLEGVWEALEARLSVDDVDWKESRPEGNKGTVGKGKK